MQADPSTTAPLERPTLVVLIASTRPGRVGLPVGRWVYQRAVEFAGFEVKLVDLAELGLPFLDEPKHPAQRQYVHDHTKAWSAIVDGADAFIFVFPEYNNGITAPLKNAIDFVSQEWGYKPVGLVSYGGQSGGLRAAQMVKQVVTTLKMVPVAEAVAIPFVQESLDDAGTFAPGERVTNAASTMLHALQRWADA
jgi:NAD(P)H-dependent FMN reductase